jgi:hypothetical protein
LPEDVVLHVEGENIYTGDRALLHNHAEIQVYPNPHLDLFLEADVIDYGNSGQIRIHNAQASVAYHIIASPLFPFAYNDPIADVDYADRPAENGEFVFAFGPLTYPITGRMIATKPITGLSIALDLPQLPFSLQTRPNHTLVPDIVDNEIPFMEYGLVVISPTEPNTYYQLVDANGDILSEKGYNERGSTLVLDCGPFADDTDIYLHAYSDLTELESVTTTPARMLVGPDPNFTVTLEPSHFNPQHGASVAVTPTRTSTDYTLYLIEGDQYAWMPGRITGTTLPGNDGQIFLHSGRLTGIRYLAYVHAQKRSSGLFARSLSAVVFYAGIRTDSPVSLDAYRVPYGYVLSLLIEYTQPQALYEVYAVNGQLLGSMTCMEEGAPISMSLAPVYQDGPLRIHVTNLLTSQVAQLDSQPWVEVGPRGDLTPTLPQAHVSWQGMGQISIPSAQAGVRYLAIVQASNDPGWPNGYPYSSIFAQSNNVQGNNHTLTFGNAMYDVELQIQARKDNGLEAWLLPVLSLKVSPNPTLKVRSLLTQVAQGQTGLVSIENPQPGVYYQLHHAQTNATLSGRFYAGVYPGIQALMNQHGATSLPLQANVLRITTYPLMQRGQTQIRVRAYKVINDLAVTMNDLVNTHVH